jgi:hypothetical protein
MAADLYCKRTGFNHTSARMSVFLEASYIRSSMKGAWPFLRNNIIGLFWVLTCAKSVIHPHILSAIVISEAFLIFVAAVAVVVVVLALVEPEPHNSLISFSNGMKTLFLPGSIALEISTIDSFSPLTIDL